MNLLDRYYAVVLREQTRELKKYARQKEKFDNTIQMLTPACTTQRYWQAVNKAELCIKEIERLKNEMNYLDSIYCWKENIHQERFNFIDKNVLDMIQ